MQNQDFLDHTLNVWQPYYKEALDKADAAAIAENWLSCINFFADWSVAYSSIEDNNL